MQTNKKVNKYKCWLQKDKKNYIPHGNYNIYKEVFVLKIVSLLIFNVILSIFLYHLINSSLGEQTAKAFLGLPKLPTVPHSLPNHSLDADPTF